MGYSVYSRALEQAMLSSIREYEKVWKQKLESSVPATTPSTDKSSDLLHLQPPRNSDDTALVDDDSEPPQLQKRLSSIWSGDMPTMDTVKS